jgi:hypothetical protein
MLAAALLGPSLTILPSPAWSGEPQLVGTVTWMDKGSNVGTVLFQGNQDGTTLTGHLYAGRDVLRVSGTIGADNVVRGVVSDADGQPVGAFTGSLDAEQHLTGSYSLGTEPSGDWTAPAKGVAIATPRQEEPPSGRRRHR